MSSASRIRVGIVDDHAIVRRGLRRVVDAQPDMTAVGEAWDGRSAIDLVRRCTIDVLVLDLLMPGQGGMDVLAILRAKAPCMAVLVLSSAPEKHYALQVMRRGAQGFLNKQREPDEILRAIRATAAGQHYFTDDTRDQLIDDALQGLPRHPHENLSEREFQLLVRLACGQGTNEIAQALSLSPKTTSTYRTALLGKLGLHTNSELTHYAMVHGLID